MTIHVSREKIKDGHVDEIEEPSTLVVRRNVFHQGAIV